MDQVLNYLQLWHEYPETAGRIQLLMDAYKEVKCSERLADWRFAPGRLRPENEGRGTPMYCAFAATPFEGDDWFILRMVSNPNQFSIGFCPDYGKQDPSEAEFKPYTNRRREIYDVLLKLQLQYPYLLHKAPFPEPASKGQPHAFKGFEHKFPVPVSYKELADKFVETVTEWVQLLEKCI